MIHAISFLKIFIITRQNFSPEIAALIPFFPEQSEV